MTHIDWRKIPGNQQAFKRMQELVNTGKGIGFVGAGASAGLYPLWPQLIEQLADAAIAGGTPEHFKKAWRTMNPLQAARQIRQRLGEGPFAEFIGRNFGPTPGADGKRFTPIHAALARLSLQAFVTTNYDPALTYACQEQHPTLRVCDFDWRHGRVTHWLQGRFANNGELAILHAHGQYDEPKSLVLDAKDYRRTYSDDRYRKLFEQLWTHEQLLIIGFGFHDPWLEIFADQALSHAGAREASDRRHLALIGLPAEDESVVELRRNEIEEPYHLQALLYPVYRRQGPDGKEQSDHSALQQVLEELIAATTKKPTAAAPKPGSPPAKPTSDQLPIWYQHVAEELCRQEDHFNRPEELQLLEQAWVQVKVLPVLTPETPMEERAEGKNPLFQQPTTLDKVLALTPGAPYWNTGRWLLEGSPGSGKTTLLRHLAVRLAKDAAAKATNSIPVFVSLPRLVRAKQELLQHATDGLGLAGADHVREALAQAGHDGRLIILLDGYDEVPQEKRQSVRRLLIRLKQDPAWASCRLVISSRPIGRGDALKDLPQLDLQPLANKRRQEFLEKWLRHGGEPDWQHEAKEALKHFLSSRSLRELSGIPLYLTLLAVLWEQGIRPPGHLATLYNQIFELLLNGSYSPNRKPMPIQDDVREALAFLAYGMTEDDLWAEPAKRLESRLRELPEVCRKLGALEAWREDLYAFLRDVHEKTQILGPHDGHLGEWRFWHRTFREALTAEQLYRQHQQEGDQALVEWAQQLEEGGEGRWAEPLALLASRLDNADKLVLSLGEANPKLAVRAAAFAQGLQPKTVHQILRLSDDLEERAKVFESIPDLLGDAEACLALVEQLKKDCRNGFDLFWLWWIVEQVEDRWHPSSRTQALFESFFHHIPPPPNTDLLKTIETPLKGLVPLWSKIPAGDGWVGSPKGEEGHNADEGPRHRIRILKPYWLSTVPVTNAQYAAFDPNKDFYRWPGVPDDQLLNHPRVNMTWFEAVSFCRWLATLPQFTGSQPRLPMEEEWEYACRAGTKARFWSGDTEKQLADVGWFSDNSGDRTHRVGGKTANKFDLYDVHGNVWEWTTSPWQKERYQGRSAKEPHPVDSDALTADLAGPPRAWRVMRGGSCRGAARRCRSACRDIGNPRDGFGNRGFRVLLSSAPNWP